MSHNQLTKLLHGRNVRRSDLMEFHNVYLAKRRNCWLFFFVKVSIIVTRIAGGVNHVSDKSCADKLSLNGIDNWNGSGLNGCAARRHDPKSVFKGPNPTW